MTGIDGPFRVRFHGYDTEQVDRLVSRIETTLAGTGRDAVSVPELQYGIHFDFRARGYDRSEVDSFIAESIAALRRNALAA
jgi:cell division septum initiation protein DivIVA